MDAPTNPRRSKAPVKRRAAAGSRVAACPEVRVGPIQPLADLLRKHGLKPDEILTSVGLPTTIFSDPDNWISFSDLSNLLQACSARSGCSNCGLWVGSRFRLDSLGLLGQLMRNSPTLRDALRLGALHLNLHDRGALSLTLDLGDEFSALGYALFDGTLGAAEEILDGAIAMQFLLLRELCGPEWKPAVVQFSHRPPADITALRNFFGPRIEFNAQLSANVFESRWLDQPVRGANGDTYAALMAEVAKHEEQSVLSFTEQVRRSIYAVTITGTANESSLARLFGLNERTFRRRLEEEGNTLRALLSTVRREWSRHLLSDTELSVSEVAWILGYSDPTVFARAFRTWTAYSPSEWRLRRARST
jgi:AraC-like DNA-binding protein